MALSASTNFKLTALQLIQAAYRKVGISVALSSSQQAVGLESANILLKSWSTRGLKMWLVSESSITMTAGAKSYSITSRTTHLPYSIDNVYRRDSNGLDTPMTITSREEYMRLANKSSSGIPINFYYHKDAEEGVTQTGNVYVWPAPDATAASEYTIRFSWKKPVDDLDSTSDDVEIPSYWYRALIWNIAKEIMIEVDVPETVENRIVIEAAASLREAEESDIETEVSVFFQPMERY